MAAKKIQKSVKVRVTNRLGNREGKKTYKGRTVSANGKKLTRKGRAAARRNDLRAIKKGTLGKNQMAAAARAQDRYKGKGGKAGARIAKGLGLGNTKGAKRAGGAALAGSRAAGFGTG